MLQRSVISLVCTARWTVELVQLSDGRFAIERDGAPLPGCLFPANARAAAHRTFCELVDRCSTSDLTPDIATEPHFRLQMAM